MTIKQELYKDHFKVIIAECISTIIMQEAITLTLLLIKIKKQDSSCKGTIKRNKNGLSRRTRNKQDPNLKTLSKTFII